MKSVYYFVSVAIISLFISCSSEKEEPDTNVDSITIYVGKTKDLGIKGDYLSSDNPFVASVGSDGIVKADHIGSTYINTKKKKIPTTVLGYYHLYDDPVVDWGCSQSTVRAKQKQGTLISSTDKDLTYQNVGSATAMSYVFENGRLKSVGVILEPQYASSITEHLLERYFMIPYVTGEIVSMGYDTYDVENAKVSVGVGIYGTYIMVIYLNAEAVN